MFAGEHVTLDIEVENAKLLPLRLRLDFPHEAGLRPIAPRRDADADAYADADADANARTGDRELHVGSYATAKIRVDFAASARGVRRLGPVLARTSDFLDLHFRDRRAADIFEIVVYPRRAPILPFDLPFRDFFGIHPTRGLIEDPAWYAGTREYDGSRPARHIHWKASAWLGRLQEKLFEPTSHRKALFLFEGEGFARADDATGFESALEILAALLERFVESGASVALATDRHVEGFPASLPFGRGPEQLGRALEMLARCSMDSGYAAALADARHQAGRAGILVIARQPPGEGAGSPASHEWRPTDDPKGRRIVFLYARSAAGGAPHAPALRFSDLLAREDAELLENASAEEALP